MWRGGEEFATELGEVVVSAAAAGGAVIAGATSVLVVMAQPSAYPGA